MPRGTPLSTLLTMLKAECGYEVAAGVATGDDAMLKMKLDHQQRMLASAAEWGFFRVRHQQTLAVGTRYGVMPAFDISRPYKVNARKDDLWLPLEYGVDNDPEFNAFDSEATETSDRLLRWQYAPGYEAPTTITAPGATAITAIADGGAGLLTTGTYRWKVSFLTPAGELFSATTAYATASGLGSKQAALSGIITEPNQLAYGRRIYRTAADGTTYYLVGTINDNTTTTFTDNVADASLSVLLGTSIPTNTQFQQFEVWPIPSVETQILFTGSRQVFPLVNDTDQCDLDDLLIVLFCAAGVLASRKNAVAPLVLSAARDRFNLLKAATPTRTPVFSLSGEKRDRVRPSIIKQP